MKSFRTVVVVALLCFCAALGARAVAASAASGVQLFDAATVRQAFTKGTPLLETGAYKVHASRRDAAGEAEVHVGDTDIFYVLEGSAEIVTGGRLVGARDVAPGERRGATIEGGSAQILEAGDVLVIPSGVAHWFRRVDGNIVYYVVKVTSES